MLSSLARAVLVEALEAAPADPAAWLRLAQLESALLDIRGAAAALRASYRLGPVAPELAVGRATLGFGLWDWLAERMHERVVSELTTAFRADPATLVRVAAATARLAELRRELATDQSALAVLERELAALRRAAADPLGGSG